MKPNLITEGTSAKEKADATFPRMEPDLEFMAGTLTPSQRRLLARKYYRWAKQLWVTAHILQARLDSSRPRPPSFRPLRSALLARN